MRRWDTSMELPRRPRRPLSPPKPPKLFLFLFLLLLAALGAVASLLWITGKEEAPKPKPKFKFQLRVEGVIVDEETGRPVEAEVYLDGRLLYQGVHSFSVGVPSGSELRVEAPGYHPWALQFRYELRGSQVFKGPVRLMRKTKERNDR